MTVSRHMVLLEKQKRKCFYCGCSIRFFTGKRREKHNKACAQATKDHFVPDSLKGGSTFTNFVFACEQCNTEKGDRLPTKEEWKKFMKLQIAFWTEIKIRKDATVKKR